MTDRTGEMSTTGSNSYLRDAVMTATPEQLQLMLYDGAIRFATHGKEAIEAKDFEKSYNSLTRAQAIILEMQRGLRREINPELVDNMSALYNFLYRKLVSACVERDIDQIEEAVRILKYQRETWVMLMEKISSAKADGQAPQASPPPKAPPAPPVTQAPATSPLAAAAVNGAGLPFNVPPPDPNGPAGQTLSIEG